MSETVHRVSIDNVVFSTDQNHPPVLNVASGDTIIFECRDAFNQGIRKHTDLPTDLDFERVNPATGPVYIEGAEPGDTLEVHIEKIKVAAQGACCIVPNFGYLAPEFPDAWTKIIPIKDGYAEFGKGIRIPIDPFPGTLVVAPLGEGEGTLVPKDHGGNMDTKAIKEGTVLYLPVFVPGALFGVGDVHAVQGDGEVCGTAVEVDAEVTIRVVVNKKKKIQRPQIETPDFFMTTAYAETTDEAVKIALRDMIDWLEAEKGLTRQEAYALCSCAVDMRISQLVDITPGVRVVLPKAIFP
ncbi:MAG: acetamidase/formamidase family protein [Promethearchaeota archaeon]